MKCNKCDQLLYCKLKLTIFIVMTYDQLLSVDTRYAVDIDDCL